MDTHRQLKSVRQVISLLGGINAVAEMTGALRTSVHNWRATRRFPARYYVVMTSALAKRDASAPHALWGQEGVFDHDGVRDAAREGAFVDAA